MLYLRRMLCFACCIIFCTVSMAQDEEGFETNAGDSSATTGKNNMQFLRLKKSYVLGDGITLTSGVGTFNLKPTFQASYAVSSANKKLTDLHSAFAINRARLTLVSNFIDKKIILVTRVNFPANYQSATSGNRSFNNTLQEAYIEYRPSIAHVINFGLRADYVDSRETRFQGENLAFVDRSSLSASFDGIFDYGIRYKGNYRLGGRSILRPYFSITTGDSRAGLQKNFGGFRYGIRLDYLPFDKFSQGGEFYMEDLSREQKPKLVVGVVYSYNDGQSSAFGTNGGRWLYGDAGQSVLVPSYKKIGADYLFKYDGFYSLGEYVHTSANVPSGIKGEFRLTGLFVPYSSTQTEAQTAAIVLSRLNIGSAFNFQAGYVFDSDWAIGGRFTSLKADDASAAFANYHRSYTAVVTRYISGRNLKIQTEAGFDDLLPNLKTATQTGNYYAQVMVTVQL